MIQIGLIFIVGWFSIFVVVCLVVERIENYLNNRERNRPLRHWKNIR